MSGVDDRPPPGAGPRPPAAEVDPTSAPLHVPPPAGDRAGQVPDEAPRRLHPLGILRQAGLRSLFGYLPLALFAIADGQVVLLLLAAAAFVVGLVVRAVAWTRHTYELRDGRVVERSGIISRSERALDIERIQQVDVERTLLDRVVGTCELRLETAADSGESELTLTVVSHHEAQRLRSVLATASARLSAAENAVGPTAATAATATGAAATAADAADGADPGDATGADGRGGRGGPGGAAAARANLDPPGPRGVGDDPGSTLLRVPLHHVALGAVTGPRLLAIPAGIAVLLGTVGDALGPRDPERATDAAGDLVETAADLGPVAASLLALAGVVVALVATAVLGILRDGGFRIDQRGREVVVRRGLTTTRSATVPLRRIQRVSVKRSWLHGLLGFATMTIHTAGSVARGGGQGDGQSALDRSLTVPLLPEGEVDALLDALLGTADVPQLDKHPRSARRRLVLRSAAAALPLAIPVATFGVATERVVVAATLAGSLVVLGAVIGLARYARLATGLGGRLIAGRTGVLGSNTVLAPRRKVQGVSVTSSWFQRRRDLATVAVHVAGPSGGLELRDLGSSTAAGVVRTLT